MLQQQGYCCTQCHGIPEVGKGKIHMVLRIIYRGNSSWLCACISSACVHSLLETANCYLHPCFATVLHGRDCHGHSSHFHRWQNDKESMPTVTGYTFVHSGQVAPRLPSSFRRAWRHHKNTEGKHPFLLYIANVGAQFDTSHAEQGVLPRTMPRRTSQKNITVLW